MPVKKYQRGDGPGSKRRREGRARAHSNATRPGDWTCPSCKANVFASKHECYRCHTPQPGGNEGDGVDSTGGGRGHYQPNRRGGRHFAQSFKATQSSKEVFALLETIQQEGTMLDVKLISMAVSALGRMRGEWRQALELLQMSKSKYIVNPDVITYNAAISACEKGRQWKRALELLEEMANRGLEPNVITYSAAISACEKGGQWKRALKLLEEMKSRSIEPNVISYNAAVSACEKGGQWERALELLEEMMNCGIETDVISYSAAISACEKGGQWTRALKLLKQMKCRGIEPDDISYNAAISACEKGGQWERALEVLEEMKSNGLNPDVISYSAAISACEKGGQWEQALDLLQGMKSHNIQPDVVSYSAAISVCEKGLQWERALHLLEEMKSRGVKPDVVVYNAAISACEKGKQWKRTLELLEDMKRCRVEPDVVSYRAVLEALPRSELPRARNILKQAIADGQFRVWNSRVGLDFHMAGGCPAAVARVILHHTLLEYAEGSRKIADLAVVTGQGHGSGDDGPVLPISTRQFLAEEMDPALEIWEVPNNPGRFVVPAASIQQWVSHLYVTAARNLGYNESSF